MLASQCCDAATGKCRHAAAGHICKSCNLYSAVQVLSKAKPLTKPAGYAGTTNLRRFYERERLPAGLAVVGDAVCAFNPVSPPSIAVSHGIEGWDSSGCSQVSKPGHDKVSLNVARSCSICQGSRQISA